MKELASIQDELKAPKGQFNSFGKYKYRSAEDILEALKPLLKEQKCYLTLSDNVELIGNRYYLTATARITNSEGISVEVKAMAREEDTKKGMDGSQITGTASSYARKYALNGLFAIDDTKDADTDEHQNVVNKAQVVNTQEKKKAVFAMNTVKDKEKLLQWLVDMEQIAIEEGKRFSLLGQLQTLYIVDSNSDDFKQLTNLFNLKKA